MTANLHADSAAALLQLFCDGVLDHALITLNVEGVIESWNRGAQRLFGWEAREAIGQPYDLLYLEEARQRREPKRDLAIALERGELEGENWRIHKDGRSMEVYFLLKVLHNMGGTHTGFAVMTRDITAQQRALQDLLDQKRRLRSVVETAVDAVVIIDEFGVIESFNPAGEKMFGYRADEVIGHNVKLLMPEPFAAEHTSYIQRYLRTGAAKIIGVGREVQARRKDGSLFPADLAVSEFHDGKPLFTGILRDISERKRMEAEVLQIAEAEQRRIGQELHDDAQQQLAGLTMIARHATDALTPFLSREPGLTDVQAKFNRVVQGLRDTNQSLRVLARGLVPMQVDAHGLVDALRQLAGQVVEQHRVNCTLTADDGFDLNHADFSTHFYRIAQEAITNALKHASASSIAIRLKDEGHTATLEIEDDGSGIGDSKSTIGRGLQIMAYRAGLCGAVLTVRRGDRGGTLVSCSLPRLK